MNLSPSSYEIAQWLFLKCLALNYLFAFWSIYMQVIGLYGAKGIVPVKEYLQANEERAGFKPYFRIPSLFWLNSSDRSLKVLSLLGMVAAVLVLVGVVPAPLFLFMWIAYLSYTSVCPFFSHSNGISFF